MTTIYAYLTKYSDLQGVDLHKATQEQLAAGLSFYRDGNMGGDWVLVGSAEVTIKLDPKAKVVKNAVASLRREQKAARAEFTRKDTEIERRINTLLAIEGHATEVSA